MSNEQDDRWEEVKAVCLEYQERLTELGRQGDQQAALVSFNWEKMQRAKDAQTARDIAERVLDPNRSFEVGGNIISF